MPHPQMELCTTPLPLRLHWPESRGLIDMMGARVSSMVEYVPNTLEALSNSQNPVDKQAWLWLLLFP